MQIERISFLLLQRLLGFRFQLVCSTLFGSKYKTAIQQLSKLAIPHTLYIISLSSLNLNQLSYHLNQLSYHYKATNLFLLIYIKQVFIQNFINHKVSMGKINFKCIRYSMFVIRSLPKETNRYRWEDRLILLKSGGQHNLIKGQRKPFFMYCVRILQALKYRLTHSGRRRQWRLVPRCR